MQERRLAPAFAVKTAPTVSYAAGWAFVGAVLTASFQNHTDTSCPADPASATFHEAGLQPAIAVKTAPTVNYAAGWAFVGAVSTASF